MLTDLVSLFPDLLVDGYRRTGDPTDKYNCIAWAAGEDHRWWEPDSLGLLYWPDGVTRKWDQATLVELFESRGYSVCTDESHEVEFEKIAIYEKNGKSTHSARQLDSGDWTSKLGSLDDISHTLRGVSGDEYGAPTVFLKRPRS